MVMKALRLPALALAVLLQLVPFCRTAALNSVLPPAGFEVVFKCLLGAAAFLGSHHAVSAATEAVIAGVSNTNPIGPVTTNATGRIAQPFSYLIIVTNPGKDHAQDFWDAKNLPPGLTINTNIGGNGWIKGVPLEPGTWQVTLSAGNLNSDIIVYKDIVIAIQGTPVISGPPIQIVL